MGHLHLSTKEAVPKRAITKRDSWVDNHEAFQKLRALIFNGKLGPYQQAWIDFTDEDVQASGEKHPWRTAANRMKALLREAHMEAEYEVRKQRHPATGQWIVKVNHIPPMVAPRSGKVKVG